MKLIVTFRNTANAPKNVKCFLLPTSQRAHKNIMKITLPSCQYVGRPRFLACAIILLQFMDAIRMLITDFLNYTCEVSYFNVSVIPSLRLYFYFDREKTGTIFRGKISVFFVILNGMCKRY
jgi:hypothetical protein